MKKRIKTHPLFQAIRDGDTCTMNSLLTAGADVNTRDGKYDQTALMQAVRDERIEAVKLLLAAGADIHARDNTVRRNLPEIAALLDA